MKNIYLIVGSWLALFAVVGIGVVAVAAPYVPPKTFAPGDPILSSDFNTMNSTLAASINNISAAQITDSTITSGKVNATFFSGAVRYSNNAIDSGAIGFDTQFHPSWTLPTARLVSSADTAQNFKKEVTGYFWGDGTDTRTIYCTQQGAGHKQGGARIPFTVTYVELYCASELDASHIVAMDVLQDSGVMTGTTSGLYRYVFLDHTASQLMTWSSGNYPAFVNNSDSHGFRVTSVGGVTNMTSQLYMFRASGY